MPRMDNKVNLKKIQRKGGGNVNETLAANAVSLFPEVVPDSKVRHAWRLVINNPNNAPVVLSLYWGDTVDRDRTTAHQPITVANYDTIILGGEDIESPELTCSPDTSASPTQGNMLYGLVDGNNLQVDLRFYDLSS